MTLHGIDVSHWQSGLQLAKTDAQFAIMKATDGTSYVDAACNGFVNQAKSAGLLWGVYHFAQNTGSLNAEADHFVDSVAGYLGHGILVLDWEHGNLANVSGAKAWLDRVYSKTGIRPLIYMSQSVAASHNWSSVAHDYALWVARYGSSYGDTGAWAAPAMWQYTNAHHTGGMNVDGDHFYGDKAAWTAFATGDSTPKPAPTPTPSPDTGDDDMPKWKNTSYGKDYTVPADGEWHVLTIGADDDGSILYSFLTGPARCSGVLNVSVAGLAPDREVDLRPVVVQTQSGKDTKVVTEFPATEFFTGGTSATAQLTIPFTQDISKGSGGAAHRLRFQIRPYGGGKVTITNVRARAVYWET